MSGFATLCAAAFSLAILSATAATAAAPPVPRLFAVPHPEMTAMVLAALTRYASGAPPTTTFDKVLAKRLGHIADAKARAGRLVSHFATLTAADRAAILPGVLDVAHVEQRPFDLAKLRKTLPQPQRVGPHPTYIDHIADQPLPQTKLQYRINYSGLVTTRRPQGIAGVSVFAALLGHVAAESTAPTPYTVLTKSLPGRGSVTSLLPQHASTTGAGAAFSSPDDTGFQRGSSDAGLLLLTALLPDDGGLDSHRQDISLLIATAQQFATMSDDDDRMTVLNTALTSCLGLLSIDDPAKWTPHAVVTQLFDYESLFAGHPQTSSGLPWKLRAQHDTAGSDVSVFFDIPNGLPDRPNVTVTISRLQATGKRKDDENGLADFAGRVAIVTANEGGLPNDSKARTFPKDSNDLDMTWKVERRVVPGQKVAISIQVVERDKGPSYKLTEVAGGWGGATIECAADPNDPRIKGFEFTGPCPAVDHEMAASPRSGSHEIKLEYDLATGAITGDATGKKGDLLTAEGNADSERRARVTFKVE